MNNVLQISIVAFFLFVARFGLSSLDAQFQVGDAALSISLIGFAIGVLVGSVYARYRRWDMRVATSLVIGAGAVLVAVVPPSWAPYVLVLDLLMIGWCMHVTGRYW